MVGVRVSILGCLNLSNGRKGFIGSIGLGSKGTPSSGIVLLPFGGNLNTALKLSSNALIMYSLLLFLNSL